MIVLGVHCGFTIRNHEPGAAISINGKIVACCEEERYIRNKEAWGKLPNSSIRAALKLAKINFSQINLIVSTGITYNKLTETLKKYFNQNFGCCPKIILVHHQLGHIAAAFYSSGFKEATCISLDGFGDQKSGLIAEVSLKNGIKKIEYVEENNSLGNFYTMVTEYLGYATGDEYKVMGLAAYGKNNLDFSKVIKINLKYWKFDTSYHSRRESPYLDTYSKKLIKEFKNYRRKPNEKINYFHKNFAASAQAMVNQSLVKIFKYAKNLSKFKDKVCFAGGVALNCTAVKEILYSRLFNEIYIPPNPSDRGLPMGCAYLGALHLKQVPKKLTSPFLGSQYSDSTIRKELENNNCKFYKTGNPSKIAANLLAKGKIIGWYQGRSEIGARALGNRSILADPRSRDVVANINDMIKMRDFWMPFCPSILEERIDDYIYNPKKINGKYMTIAFDSTELGKKEIPATLHPSDFTARPQIVNPQINEGYYRIIKEFEKITGVGCLLNTSFNLHGEPIVASPEDALDTLRRSGLKHVVLNNLLVSK